MPANLPATMKAAAIERFGGVELLKTVELPLPEFGPDEVLIRVEAADVAKWDPEEREGHLVELQKQMGHAAKFPYVLGTDGAGTVAAAGANVTHVKPGDRVYGSGFLNPKGGFYAEFVSVKGDYVAPIAAGFSTEQAGVVLADAITALQGLDDTLNLKAGESVMIIGAGGGIGHLAVQLAKRMGARVLAVASGEDGVALAKRLGADAAVEGKKGDVVAAARGFAADNNEVGIDAALVTAGGPATDRALTALKPAGRVAYPTGVTPPPKPPAGIEPKVYDGDPHAAALETFHKLHAIRPIEVVVARVFPLAEAVEAHRAVAGRYLGKIALRVQ